MSHIFIDTVRRKVTSSLVPFICTTCDANLMRRQIAPLDGLYPALYIVLLLVTTSHCLSNRYFFFFYPCISWRIGCRRTGFSLYYLQLIYNPVINHSSSIISYIFYYLLYVFCDSVSRNGFHADEICGILFKYLQLYSYLYKCMHMYVYVYVYEISFNSIRNATDNFDIKLGRNASLYSLIYIFNALSYRMNVFVLLRCRVCCTRYLSPTYIFAA